MQHHIIQHGLLAKLAVICGGPSLERGISLNSARSVMDHLKGVPVEIIPIFVDEHLHFHRLSTGQIYSNTPADFNFKLSQSAQLLDKESLKQLLHSVDLVFPLIHGLFGEDGELQALLEQYGVPFVGHSSYCCQWMFPKHQAAATLEAHGFLTCPQLILSEETLDAKLMIEDFFHCHQLERAIVKPSVGGSSIGVQSVNSPKEALSAVCDVISRNLSRHVILEPFFIGKEFTVVIFENEKEEPVALIPTEVSLSYSENAIFDYRKKYLPTNQAAYHTPPRFTQSVAQNIRLQAEQIFKLFGMRDFVRLDGWVLENGDICFTDINPISGLEQNSFFFRQSSLIGMTHRQALEYILKRTCQRYGLIFPKGSTIEEKERKCPVYVLFGNHNAERQVSLMSGTNVWLKLLQSERLAPTPFFFDCKGDVWELPYSFTLNHTVEEIYSNCLLANGQDEVWNEMIGDIRAHLGFGDASYLPPLPIRMSLGEFLAGTRANRAFVFIALHGGVGENGTLQAFFDKYQIPYNGSNAEVSALCMDKYLTGLAIAALQDPDISSTKKQRVILTDYESFTMLDLESLWQEWCQALSSEYLILKPRGDGCSAGIVLLKSARDFQRYCEFFHHNAFSIPAGTFSNQLTPIEMSVSRDGECLLEPYIDTDEIVLEQQKLRVREKTGWVELTVGVFEEDGIYQALNPSITVVEGAVLSLEEKFQGGTGINLTPPPVEVISFEATQKIKQLVEKAASGLGIQNYARLDIFYDRINEKIIVIEANTLPALTPSTVIYHQGMAENPPLAPLELLERIVFSRLKKREKCATPLFNDSLDQCAL